jgi:penicillin amidase
MPDPIIPAGTKWDFTALPVPMAPGHPAAAAGDFRLNHEPNPLYGSNNWAVSGSKTVTGSPILCGDPHLDLNLPSLWYQMQLVSPDYDVTGVTLPGVPMIIIGFNRHIAWSETNVDADVLDWYSVKFKDAGKNEYFYNGEWKATSKKIELIKVKGGADIIDTVIYTHHGPVVFEPQKELVRKDMPAGYAMRWLAHDGTTEMKAFLLLNKASNYAEYVEALKYFECPAQNFVYADAANNIAIWVNGKYPLKWKNQGKFLLDGSAPENEWQGYLPHDHVPHVINPERGFVSSANQSPADETYPYYLNWRFELVTRGHRINERLSAMNQITADSLRLLQFDNRNNIAAFNLATMLSRTDTTILSDAQKEILFLLQVWDHNATAGSTGQTIFNMWWRMLLDAIWKDELGADSLMYPEPDISINTVHYNINQRWIDNKSTAGVEGLSELVTRSFIAACDSLRSYYGSDPANWTWGDVKNTRIDHLLQIEAFSRFDMKTSGSTQIVNATGYDFGPSWRMIVELGNQPQAYGIYPGGQSGNPGSPYYDNMVSKWAAGEQNKLVILSSSDEKNPQIVSSITLKKK